MTLRNILVFPDPRLREVAQEVKIFDEKLKSLSEDLLETMYEFKGRSKILNLLFIVLNYCFYLS